MAKLRVLFIGGTGVISSACSRVAVECGIDLFVLNRGRSTRRPDWYLADPARQVTDASLDAVMDKLAAAWSQR